MLECYRFPMATLLLASMTLALSCGKDAQPTPDATTETIHRQDLGPLPDSSAETVSPSDTRADRSPGDGSTLDLPPDTPQSFPEVSDAVLDAHLLDSRQDPETETDSTHDNVEIVPLPPLADIWPVGEVVAQCNGGLMATLESPSGEIRVMVVRGTHYQMGYQAGCLIGKDVGQFFGSLMNYFLVAVEDAVEELGMDPKQTSGLLFSMLSNIWLHMKPYVPQKYVDEMNGFQDAVLANPEIAQFWQENPPAEAVRALLLLSNLSDLNWSGSLEDVLEKLSIGVSPALIAYYGEDTAQLLLERIAANLARPRRPLPLKTSCSFFAAFGDRTHEGHLLGSRNLDWSTDTGIAVVKGITIFAPDGEFMHAGIGYLGFLGALAGISEKGIILSEVGSESALERLQGEPWTIKFREILETASNLEEGLALATGTADDGKLRPPTIGYNWMVGFGDPPLGAAAAAATVESNGAMAGVMTVSPGCGQDSVLYQYGQDGAIAAVVKHEDDPMLVNLENEAVEIDADGSPRLFQVDADGAFVLNASGYPIQAETGVPFPVGKVLPCALYRGDEALLHGVRRWQHASNGPQGGDNLLCSSGSYRHRYLVMHDMLAAYETGEEYSLDGQELIPATGTKTLVDLPQAEQIARAAAMGSNVMGIAYDATALTIRLSYETGTADSWQGAHKHDYIELDIGAMFDAVKGSHSEQEEL